MNDDFAPRPCRCVVPWSIAFGLLMLVGFMGGIAIWFKIGCDVYEKELAKNARQIIDQQATIDQQARIIQAWVDEHPPTDGELEDGKMGARIIPTIRHSAEEANGAIIEMRDLGKRASKVFDDIEAGRTGFHIKFSVMKGEADVTLRKAP